MTAPKTYMFWLHRYSELCNKGIYVLGAAIFLFQFCGLKTKIESGMRQIWNQHISTGIRRIAVDHSVVVGN